MYLNSEFTNIQVSSLNKNSIKIRISMRITWGKLEKLTTGKIHIIFKRL